jgi:hypothetical protein
MSKSNQQQFFAHIMQWQQSGLSKKAWCEQNNVMYSAFHYWYKQYRNRQSETDKNNDNNFVQLVVHDRPAVTPWCELVFDGGRRLIFYHPVAAEFIRNLLA